MAHGLDGAGFVNISGDTRRLIIRSSAVTVRQKQGGICGGERATGEHVLVTEFRGMALNGLFCATMLRPLDLVPITDFIPTILVA